MTVNTEVHEQSFSVSGGVGETFTVNLFWIIATGDAKLYHTASGGTETLLAYGTNYTITGEADPSGFVIKTVTDLVDGTLRVIRAPAATQGTDYTATDDFPAESHERALDRVTMVAQTAMRRSASDPEVFDAENDRIGNVADPQDNQDAATKAYVAAQIAASDSLGLPAPDATDVSEGRHLKATVVGSSPTFEKTNEVPQPTAGEVTSKATKVLRPDTATEGAFSAWGDEAVPQKTLRNMLINGDFRVAQRGVTFTAAADEIFTLDRWLYLVETAADFDVSQERTQTTLIDNAVAGSGADAAIKLAQAAAKTNNRCAIVQTLEGRDSFQLFDNGNGKASLSFWARTGAAGQFGTCMAAILSWKGTVDAPDKTVISAWGTPGNDFTESTDWTIEGSAQFTIDENWAEFTLEDVDLDTALTKNIAVIIWIDDTSSAAGDTLYLTNVSLVQGANANSYQPRHFADELALCQRYYNKTFQYSVTPATGIGGASDGFFGAITGWASSLGGMASMWQYPVPMRATPTLTGYNPESANALWYNRTNAADGVGALGTTDSCDRQARVAKAEAAADANDQLAIHLTADAEMGV